ncbi:hypothetical protein HNP84_003722 [Thermocatellispora tengchongensis]|uniref:MFS transporter n=1 Tax=Thermocatellispora tengchongensis TaxID=1073253 RepID=A0A840P606_9ACTN|nr:hypothetical protein [Thermocatellispora tengchongensis]MBB5133996.1 hypothetical protein [Thermocatellispora tengchongensis]
MLTCQGPAILDEEITRRLPDSGMAPLMLLTTDMVVAAAPAPKAGSAAALSETSSELGIALGIAVLGSIAGAVYRHTMDGAPLTGLPEQAAMAARDSLVEAVPIAERLAGASGAELLATARDAFTAGLSAVGVISAVLAVALAATVVVVLRETPAHHRDDADANA